MDPRVRRVLARYFEEPGEIAPDFNMSWMEYLENKSKPPIDPDNPVIDMLKGKKHLNKPFNVTNPYDYVNPSDKPKDQKDSPPFVNDIDKPTMFGVFDRPNLFGDQGALEDWYKSRRQDWTTDEEEQRPAMSITRKYSSEIIPLVVPGDEFFEFVMRSKVAASYNEIINKDYHYKNDLKLDRSEDTKAWWANKNNPNQYERGLFIFKARTPGSKGGPYNVYFQFLRSDEKPGDEYKDYPVHIACTCPSFLYSGAQYYAVQDGYMYMPAFKPDLVGPKPTNQYTISFSEKYPRGRRNPGRGLNSRVCKHILAAFEIIGDTPITVHYKDYPITAPPSKIINPEVWYDLLKFPFTEKDIKERLLSLYPKVPAYFQQESVTPAVIDWFYNTWFPRTDEQKLKSLKDFANYPERVFFILIEEAYLKRKKKEHISKRLVDEGYEMMAKVVQPENEAPPQSTPETEDLAGKGTGKIDMPGVKSPEEEEEEEKEEEKKKPRAPRKIKQYGVPSEPKKVKQPGRLKKPTSVKPAIK